MRRARINVRFAALGPVNPFRSAVDVSQAIVAAHLSVGAVAVDATAGNGHDTLFLARCCGPSGRVYAFDIQEAAVERTRMRLEEHNVSNVEVILQGHEHMTERLGEDHPGAVSAVMFNLGYLPRADHDVITRPDTTLAALDQSVLLLREGGVVTIVIYSGHPGGKEEADAVTDWASGLERNSFEVIEWRHVNRTNNPPFVIAVKKLRAD